jgi:hypothetical protein
MATTAAVLLACCWLLLGAQVKKEEKRGDFYLYAIKKDGADLCATKKVIRTYVPST